MTDKTVQFIIIQLNWQAKEEEGIQISLDVKERVRNCLSPVPEMCCDVTPLNNEHQETLSQTEGWALHPGASRVWISFCFTSWNDVLEVRGGGVEANILGLGGIQLASACKANARTRGSWLRCYDSDTGQHKTMPNRPWRRYSCHKGWPSVIYRRLYIYHSCPCPWYALWAPKEVQTIVVKLILSGLGCTWADFDITCVTGHLWRNSRHLGWHQTWGKWAVFQVQPQFWNC